MKKILLSMAVMATGIFASCSKDANDVTNEMINTIQGSVVNLSFSNEVPQTKAFYGTTASAETWEMSINSIKLYAFKDGKMLTSRSFNSSEISAKKAIFPLPSAKSGDVCKFYVVANTDLNITNISEDDFLKTYESEINTYNGTFAEVTTTAKRNGGFVMSASSSATVSSGTTNVAMTLKRTVAKVAVQVSKAAGFGDIYIGDIKVKNITVSKGAIQTNVFKQSTLNTGARTFNFTQNSNIEGNNFQNLFYLYENGTTSDKVTLTINAVYDTDGNFNTTNDQEDITYTLGLDGKASGEIVRNGYYRVGVTIKGLTGSDASMSITVADWETATTQNVEMGN